MSDDVLDFRKGSVPPDVAGPPPAGPDSNLEANGAIYRAGNWPVGFARVYSFKRRWRAVDVYVDFPNPSGAIGPTLRGGILSVFVTAINQVGQIQTRTIVASGRIEDPSANGVATSFALPSWVCAARSVAQQFEVSIFYSNPGGAAIQPLVDLNVTVVGSDEAVEPPPLLGSIRGVGGGVGFNKVGPAASFNLFAPSVPFPELVGVQATINDGVVAGSARFLQLFERSGLPFPANGTVPQMIWPLGSNAGDGIFDWKVRLRAPVALVLAASSTAATLTSAVDVTMQAIIR